MAKEQDYKELSRALDEILAQLQSEEVDIDQALKLYEQGTAITKQLEAYLKSAENKVTKLKSSTGK